MKIPSNLLRQIESGNVVLFLGAGATKGAIHPEGIDSPSGKELSKLIADHFLDGECDDYPLSSVAEYAISETSLLEVQKFIADFFSKFEPAEDSHMLIPHFRWKAIVTTNYDTIVEKAYAHTKNPIQTLVKIVQDGESIDTKIKTPEDLLYLKLHGCINEANNDKIPFILTVDQYVTHRRNRERMFSKLQELATCNPILFVGHSLEDSDIRKIFLELDNEIQNRERFYIVIPHAISIQKRLWEGKKCTIIESNFADFMKKICEEVKEHDNTEQLIPNNERKSPFFNCGDLPKKNISTSLVSYIENDLEFVCPDMSIDCISPNSFYKGHSEGWYPIYADLDVRRSCLDDILNDLFIKFGEDNSPHLYLINGHAGTGKTILNKRLAWSASCDFKKKVFYLQEHAMLRFDLIEELYSLIKERIYIFIDDANKHDTSIYNSFVTARRNNIPLTIVVTERTNVWNVECIKIRNLVEQTYALKYLDPNEINDLLNVLEKHDSLGVLKGKSHDYQLKAFTEKAGRELLVALYEATQGKSFQEIVCDEFNNIPSEEAKPLYLTVCLMHSMGSFTRAGLLNRVFQVSFTDFKERFFEPLENLILTERNYYVNDYVYKSRHRIIAEFVVSGILINEQDKFDEYLRIINCLDVDYESDRNAFQYLLNGKNLLKTFRNLENIRYLYKAANERSIDDSKLMQQEAIFEMSALGGNLQRAEELLQQANELSGGSDVLILHSLSELNYKLAIKTENLLKKKSYFQKTESICKMLLDKKFHTAHPYHTIIKTKLEILRIHLDAQELAPTEKISKDIEKYLSLATQAFPEESFIIEANSNFNKLMNNVPKAKELLEEAFQKNSRSPYLASRLSSVYENEGDLDKAINVLKLTLGEQPADKDLNFKMGYLLLKKDDPNYGDIIFHLKRSFTKGDNRFNARFWYARTLYVNNQISEAISVFNELKSANVDPKIKFKPRGVIERTMRGTVDVLNYSSGLIKREFYGDQIYFKRIENGEILEGIKRNDTVSYNLAFNYAGPIAVNLNLEK